jgi:hypothetical protein
LQAKVGSKFPVSAAGLVKRTVPAVGGKLPDLAPVKITCGNTLGLLDVHVK